jgi:protein-S-isoprenylcysteine O-methyltransferase Ste14
MYKMKKYYSKLCALFLLLLAALPVFAQEKPEMADGLRSNGKIYVVVAVIVLILAGLFIYLISLDRKISRIEKENP